MTDPYEAAARYKEQFLEEMTTSITARPDQFVEALADMTTADDEALTENLRRIANREFTHAKDDMLDAWVICRAIQPLLWSAIAQLAQRRYAKELSAGEG